VRRAPDGRPRGRAPGRRLVCGVVPWRNPARGDLWCACPRGPLYTLVERAKVDRSVKIWRLPELDENADLMATEDKPVFSSAELHAGRVISVTWSVTHTPSSER
jgi:hypothetical protein